MNGFEDAVNKGRAAYKAWQGPSRQDARGTKGVIGAPPIGGTKVPDTASYREALRRKQAADRATTAAAAKRERSFGPLGQSSKVSPWGPGMGAGSPGSASTSTMLAGMPWMASPWYWLGIGGIAFLLLRKKKKKNGNGS